MSTTTSSFIFEKVYQIIEDAHLIAFDGCHKIYLAMDESQADWFRDSGSLYSTAQGGSPDELIATLSQWWNQSCGLRFISAVEGAGSDIKFTTVIGQGEFEDEDEYEDDEEDYF